MSLWRDELRASRATLSSLVVLALVAVFSVGRLIETPDFLVWALPAVVIGAGFALFFGHRSLGVGFGLLVVGGFLTLPALFARGETAGLLPTPDAVTALRKLISSGLSAAPKQTPPVDAEPQFLVLVWIGLLLLGFLGASWVIVRRPVGAVISALGIVTFTGAIGGGPGRDVYAVAAVAATIGFFLAEGRHRIGRWAGGRLRIPIWFGIPTLAIATAFALASPIVFGDQPIVQLRSALRPRVVIIKPLSDIKRQLQVDPPIEVMRVTAARPTYWRLTGLDSFDGKEWSLEARPEPIRDGVIPQPDPPTTGETLEQSVRLTSLLSPWVPAAYAARSLDSNAKIDLDERSQTLLLRGDTSPGLQYTVRSQLPRVQVNTTGPPRAVSDDRERTFGALGRPIVTGARTPLDIARKLEEHFRAFTYSEDVPAGHTVERLQQFLAERRGYCEQFAATMTLMLRGLGVDARVGVGFLPGSQSADEFVVSTREAHAWVEANIPGAGWTTFDPTPGRGAASAAPELNEPEEAEPVPELTAVPEPTPQTEDLPADVTPAGIPSAVVRTVLWSIVGLAVIGAVPTAKFVRRRRRRTRGSSDAVVLGAYAELVDRARDLGWTQSAAETYREFAARVAAGADASGELARLATRAVYGPEPVSTEDASAAWAALATAQTALAAQASRIRRIVAVFDPRTFVPVGLLRRVRGRIAVAFGRA
jgi:transglutaminase-like putative cysteine protease